MRPFGLCSRLRHSLIALALLLGPATTSVAGDVAGARDAMANAMARMMEAMGLFGGDSGKSGGSGSFDFGGQTMPGMTPGMPGIPGMGQIAPGQLPWSAFGMDRMLQQLPMYELPGMPGWHATSLEGIWEGRTGGLLIVQGHRFRLYSPGGDYIEGLIQQRGDRIALYEPRSDRARPYEFAQYQGRLILRDPEGQVYLYRRLWLDEDASGSTSRDP